MAIDKELKKKVNEEWQNAFPQLTLLAQDKLYKILGPVIIGLELIKIPRIEEYRPHFVMYGLWGNKWGNDLKACFMGPILLKQFFNKKGFQLNIPYGKNNISFNEVLESIKNQIPLPFNWDISFEKLLAVLDEYSKTPPLSAAPNSYLQGLLQESRLEIALYISIAEAENVLKQIINKSWDVNHFKMCGIDVKKWLKELQDKLDQREIHLEIIESNRNNQKINILNKSELIL